MASYESPTCMYSICIIFNILLTFEIQIYFGSLEISPCMIINFHLPGPRITDLVKSTETCMICVLNDNVCVPIIAGCLIDYKQRQIHLHVSNFANSN